MKFGGFRYALQCSQDGTSWKTIATNEDVDETTATIEEGGRRGTSLHWRVLDQTTDVVVKEIKPTVEGI